MSKTICILSFSGSSRVDSLNGKLLSVATQGARAAGAVVTEIDLMNYPMPIYNGDLEATEGQPESATALKSLMRDSHGFLISSPEYNGGYSPLLKNAIDWVSRPVPGEPRLAAFTDKTAAIMSASPGKLGGIRGLGQLRQILGNIGVLVLPDQVTLPAAQNAFKRDGTIADRDTHEEVARLGHQLANILKKVGS